MFLLSLTAPHLNLSIMCVSGIEFHLETEVIFFQSSCIMSFHVCTFLSVFPYTDHAKFYSLLFGQGQLQHKQSSKS